VSEFDDPAITADVAARAASRGFAVSAQNLEVTGLCARCRTGQADSAS
jgi:Fe2+ or Zn2+ uptake regulation protein